jgi:hypothetical protein
MSAYGRDLAYAHDAGFGHFARGAAPELLRRLRDAGLDGGLVVDLGCGSGIWARALLDAGFEVLGVDVSAAPSTRAPGARASPRSCAASTPPCARAGCCCSTSPVRGSSRGRGAAGRRATTGSSASTRPRTPPRAS